MKATMKARMKKMHFTNLYEARTLEELKKAYKKYALQFHPDKEAGNHNLFIALQNEYEQLFNKLKQTGNESEKNENSKTYKDIINALLKFNINIEIIGSWIWVSGNTHQIKEDLKKLGFKWSKNKKAWYFTSQPYKKKTKKQTSMNDIKEFYGCETVKKQVALTQ